MHCVKYRIHFKKYQLTSTPVLASSSDELLIAARKKVDAVMVDHRGTTRNPLASGQPVT